MPVRHVPRVLAGASGAWRADPDHEGLSMAAHIVRHAGEPRRTRRNIPGGTAYRRERGAGLE
jgi:hypothetical protein